ncbi:MAG: radical SAM protein [Candidatus Cloacimonetes bacterium]|nr:radical SAM protein [Candidatus Cloacimonadota bacterium]
MKYLFGPVPSRRLGVSLGIDLVPYKTCNLNCVYCEVGTTTNLTRELSEYVPTSEVISELSSYLSTRPHLDFITFSGAGEPGLHVGLGRIINWLKTHYPEYRLALLTNGILMADDAFRQSVVEVDVVLPSLDAVSESVFQSINRPALGIHAEDYIRGLIEFRKLFKGEIWLEVFLVPGINDTVDELDKIYKVIRELAPDKVQLNTLDRPGTEDWVVPLSNESLLQIKHKWSELPIEIPSLGILHEVKATEKSKAEGRMLAMLSRRPCTESDIISSLGLSVKDVRWLISRLIASGKIIQEQQKRGVFYKAVNTKPVSDKPI